MKIAVFPGSFDPITNGHISLLERSVPLFDKIYLAIGINPSKKYLFSLDQRKAWLEEVAKKYPNVEVESFEGLTVNYCKEKNAEYLVRGLRNSSDFDYEKTISQLNNSIGDGIETVFFIAHPGYSHISSTIVRELYTAKADISKFVPECIARDLKA